MGLGWWMTLSHMPEFGRPLGTLIRPARLIPPWALAASLCLALLTPDLPRVLQVLPLIPEPAGNFGRHLPGQPASCADPPPSEDIWGWRG